MANLHIEDRPLRELKPYARNARTHSKRQIKQIARSIERFGWTNPVLVSDEYEIIAGHGRVEAARLLGHQTVPVVRLSHLSDEERRAYVIADNALATKSGWNRDILAIELQALSDFGFELELTGFELGEINVIFEEAAEKSGAADGPEDVIPSVTEEPAICCPGELWHLGEHRIICADARDETAYDTLLAGEKAHLVFADVPYNVPIGGHVSGLGKVKHAEFAMASGEMSEDEFIRFLTQFLERARANVCEGAILFVCMDWRHLFELLSAGRASALALKNLCVWNKNNGGMGSLYRSKHELIAVYKAGTEAHVNTVELGRHGRNRTNVWDYAGVNTFRKGRNDELAMHPTVKPVALVADAIKDVSKHRDIVLDPFSGSGTTLIAAEKTGRRARMIELEPRYVDVAIRRWQTFTGRNAKLAGGPSFEDIDEQRSRDRASAKLGVQTNPAAPIQ